jgi:hypothetical protein
MGESLLFQEWIHDPDAIVVLAVVEVFGEENYKLTQFYSFGRG